MSDHTCFLPTGKYFLGWLRVARTFHRGELKQAAFCLSFDSIFAISCNLCSQIVLWGTRIVSVLMSSKWRAPPPRVYYTFNCTCEALAASSLFEIVFFCFSFSDPKVFCQRAGANCKVHFHVSSSTHVCNVTLCSKSKLNFN